MLWHLIHYFKPNWIFHLAAVSHLPSCNADPINAIKVNVNGVSDLLVAAKEYFLLKDTRPALRIVLAGSGEEYGIGDPERNAPLSPRNLYGATKAAGSMLAAGFWHAYGLPVSIARMATIYGPGQTGKFVASVIEKLLKGEEITLHNEGTAMRDWL